MKFACNKCGAAIPIRVGHSLSEVVCPQCSRPLELSSEQQTIGGYQLEMSIGSGGYGSVWKARDIDSGQVWALKLIPKRIVPEEERIHLLREVRSSRFLSHPRVVAATEFGENEDYWFLVSEYVNGIPLGRWARQYQPSINETAELCADVGDTIHYVHEQGFIHRDLKPGNIIIDEERHPHIIDFGLCRSEHDEQLKDIERYRQVRHVMNEDPSGSKIFGTPAYVSPEQTSGNGMETTPQSDIYSLGVILYELLTGVRPYRGTGRRLIRQIRAGRPRRPRRIRKDISREMEAICLKAISKNAEERYATGADFAADCRNATIGEAISARLRRNLFGL